MRVEICRPDYLHEFLMGYENPDTVMLALEEGDQGELMARQSIGALAPLNFPFTQAVLILDRERAYYSAFLAILFNKGTSFDGLGAKLKEDMRDKWASLDDIGRGHLVDEDRRSVIAVNHFEDQYSINVGRAGAIERVLNHENISASEQEFSGVMGLLGNFTSRFLECAYGLYQEQGKIEKVPDLILSLSC